MVVGSVAMNVLSIRRCVWPLAVSVVLACGGKPKPVDDTLPDDPAPAPARSELETRRDAACETLGPKITTCAIDDARRTMSPAELAELDPEKIRPVHTREFIEGCKAQALSSRQVRVYEVCMAEETACDPLLACLENVKPTAGDAP